MENQLINSHKEEIRKREENAIYNIKTNSKHFYWYDKCKTLTKMTIGPFLIGQLKDNWSFPKQKSDELLKQYCKVHNSDLYNINLIDIILKPGPRVFGHLHAFQTACI